MTVAPSIDPSRFLEEHLAQASPGALPGSAAGRHYAANLMTITPKSSWPWVKTLLRTIYDQASAEEIHAQFKRVLDTLTEKLPAVAAHLDDARADILAFTAFPRQIWRQI